MADEFIAKCTLFVNGEEETNFKAVREMEYTARAQVMLMNKTGFTKRQARYGLVIDYVRPATGTPRDWDALENGTIVIEYEGGSRVLYSGCAMLSSGEGPLDGENEYVRSITVGAEDRKEE